MTTTKNRPVHYDGAVRSVLRHPEDKGCRGAERYLITKGGKRIGGSYQTLVDSALIGSRAGEWVSWGIAGGLHGGFRTRAEAEAVQIAKWHDGPTHIAVVRNMQSKAEKVLGSWMTEQRLADAIARWSEWQTELNAREAILTGESY